MRYPFLLPSVLRTGALLVCFAPVLVAEGEILTVTTLDDVSDIQSASVGSLPGPDGKVSFREALAVSNQVPGAQTIEFAIPASEFWLFNDQALLRLEDGAFFVTGDETTIDFSSQTIHIGDTNPNGGEVGIYGLQPNGWGTAAIFVSANDCVIRGLDRVLQRGYGLEISGDGNRVVGCTISGAVHAGIVVEGYIGDPAVGNIIGGTQPGEGNVLSGGSAGLRVDGPCDGTVVVGNTLIGSPYAGVEVRGAYCCPDYTPRNTRIGGPTPEERNWIADNGSYGEEGFPQGTQVQVEWAVNTIVEGNYIGTTELGDARFPGASGTTGVGVRESETTVVRNNLVSGMRKEGVNHYDGQVFGTGISVYGPNTGVQVVGNLVGTDASGVSPIPNLDGLSFGVFQGPPSGARVGGADPGDANTVAFQERHGVIVASGVSGVTVQGNSIHSNGTLGIDLLPANGATGVTPNDPGDGDGGANGGQNFPELNTARIGPAGLEIQGSLDSQPGREYRLDFYVGAACDPSGNGEGERFVGSALATTNVAGSVNFDVALSGIATPGETVTATATDTLSGSTSEFSGCVALVDGSGVFVNMGLGLAGATGVPQLTGSGALAAGTMTAIALVGASPNAPALLIVGTQAEFLPLLGGTLVPAPHVLLALQTDAQGASSLNAPWPAALGAGTSVYFQEWIVDSASAHGASASNALGVMTP